MGSILKGYRYRIVDNRSFELPLPIKYVLLKEDNEIAEYEILADEKINCRIITKYKENMITPIYRPLTISDVYYFFSCRVFQDKTPFTGTELALLGLERYSVYDIIRKTRGITPYDNYWLRFEGDKCSYDKAKKEWDEIMSSMDAHCGNAPDSAANDAGANTPQSVADINEILNQQKVDVASKLTEEAVKAPEPAPMPEPEPSSSNTMSESEIEALLMRSGLADMTEPDVPEEPKSSGGTMSQDDIEKMLAGVSAPAEEPAPSGGKMNQDDIEKMLAAATASVEEAAPAEEPAPVEEAKPSGGKMNQDDIEKMLAAASASVEEAAPAEESAPAPAEEAKPSGGKMNQDDIEKMLAAATASVEEAAPAEEPAPAPAEEAKPSGGKMNQDDIEKMLAAASEAVQEPLISEPEQPAPDAQPDSQAEQPTLEEPDPAEEAKPSASGGKMSQADIEALLNGMADDAK